MKRILAIDDNNDNLISLKAIIEDVFPESTLFTANNGIKGIELAMKEDPDVILLDIVMPEMDGFEVCRRLKLDDDLKDIPVVFLTALKETKASRIKALEYGAEAFLSKPIDETELKAQINAMVKIKASNDFKKTEKERLTLLVAERTKKLEQSQIATQNLLNDLKSEMIVRSKMEGTLKENEEKYRLLFENMEYGVFYQMADGSINDINPAGLKMLGLTFEQINGRTSFHPEWKVVDESFQVLEPQNHPSMLSLKSGKIIRSKILGVYNPIDKEYKWLNLNVQPEFKNGDKMPFRVFVTMIDITEQKKAEEELRKSEQKYRKIFENTDDIIFQINAQGELIDVSPSVLKHSGYTREELLGTNVEEIYNQTGKFANLVQEIDNSGKFSDFEILLKRKDNELRWFTLNAHIVYDEQSNPMGYEGSLHDITDRKIAQDALKERESLLQAFINNAPFEIWARDKNGNGIIENKAMVDHFGSILGSKPEDSELPKDVLELWKSNNNRVFNGETLNEECVYEVRSEKRFFQQILAPIIVNEEITGIAGFNIDITDRKKAEEALKESEGRVRAKLEAILSPDGDVGSLELIDIINPSVVQSIMDDFYKLTNIGVAIEDLSGNVIVATGWQDICTKFHRVHPETLKNCIESDTKLTLNGKENKTKKCKCKNNMWDISTPILIGNKKLGNLFLGQFFYDDEKIDYELFRNQAKKYGFNEEEYIDALNRVPRWNKETIDRVMAFYISIAKLISNLSYSNIKLARLLEEHRKTENKLRESNELFQAIFNNNAAAIAIIETDTTLSMVNDAYCKVSGFSREEIIGQSWTQQIVEKDLKRLKEYNKLRIQNPQDAPSNYEFSFYHKSGSIRTAIISVSMIERSKKIIVSFVDISDIKHTQEDLRKNVAFLDSIIENIPLMIFIKDAKDLKFIRFNKVGGEIVGSPVENFIGKNDYDFFPKEQADFFIQKDREVLNGYEVVDIPEEELQSKENGTRILHTRKVPVLNEEGHPEFLLGISEDITERKIAELQFKESNDRFKAISEFSHNAICIVDELGKIIWANEALVIMGGYLKDTLYQSPSFVEYIGAESVEFVVSNFMKFATKQNYEHFYRFYFIRSDGEQRLCEKYMTDYTDLSGKRNLVISMLDVTEKIKTETALIKSEKHYKLITEKITDVIWLMDLTGKSFFVSPSIESFTGYSINEYLNQTIEQRFTKESATYGMGIFMRELKYYQHNLKRLDNYSIKMELEYLCKAGGTKWGELIISPYFSDTEELLGIHGVTRDITERKKKEFELEIAKEKAEESDRLKTAFLHNISHEIRTPMNAIVGFSKMLQDEIVLPDEQKHFTDIIVQSSNQLLSIITDIINIATVEAGQEKIQESNCNINNVFSLIQEQYDQKAKLKNINLVHQTYFSNDEAFIITDETKLIQIISNLINNALKFTTKGFIEYSYKLEGNVLLFYVKDSGIGIPSEMHDEIFKRFRQVESDLSSQFGGSGLGLSISQAYVELLGGKIWLDSEKEKGTTFYFTLPYKKAKKEQSIKKIDEIVINSVLNKEITMLIAEDEDVNFMLANRILTSLKFNIIRAINGKEAVEICASNPNINIVLMDIKMPVMNGYDATVLIKKSRPELPIIALTAYSNEADREKAISCGCADFISKPFKREDLILKIKELLD